MNQKSIDRTKLKNVTGVTDKDLLKDKNYQINQTRNKNNNVTSQLPPSEVTTPDGLQTRNFIIEQKNRFLKGKQQQKQNQFESNSRYRGTVDHSELNDWEAKLNKNRNTSLNKINDSKMEIGDKTINKGKFMLSPTAIPIKADDPRKALESLEINQVNDLLISKSQNHVSALDITNLSG